MQSGLSRAFDQIRQPEYTGENRCIPCTTVNVVIAAVLATGIAVFNPLLAIAAFVASLAAIYLRGYLVPGTPALTKQYFPDWLLAKFDKGPAVEEQSYGIQNMDVIKDGQRKMAQSDDELEQSADGEEAVDEADSRQSGS